MARFARSRLGGHAGLRRRGRRQNRRVIVLLYVIRNRWPLFAAVLAAAALLVAACGGGDGGGAGTDESYVKGMCEAFRSFEEDSDKALAELEGKFEDVEDDEDFEKLMEEAFRAFAEPVRNLANDASKVKPPEDIKPYHDQVVASLRTAADSFEEGNLNFDEDPFEDLPEPPQSVQDRLRAVADDEPACQGLDIFS